MKLCGRCSGSKEIWGIGGMYVTCPQCAGSGKHREPLKVEDVADKLVEKVEEKPAVVKRSRKKKDAA